MSSGLTTTTEDVSPSCEQAVDGDLVTTARELSSLLASHGLRTSQLGRSVDDMTNSVEQAGLSRLTASRLRGGFQASPHTYARKVACVVTERHGGTCEVCRASRRPVGACRLPNLVEPTGLPGSTPMWIVIVSDGRRVADIYSESDARRTVHTLGVTQLHSPYSWDVVDNQGNRFVAEITYRFEGRRP